MLRFLCPKYKIFFFWWKILDLYWNKKQIKICLHYNFSVQSTKIFNTFNNWANTDLFPVISRDIHVPEKETKQKIIFMRAFVKSRHICHSSKKVDTVVKTIIVPTSGFSGVIVFFYFRFTIFYQAWLLYII